MNQSTLGSICNLINYDLMELSLSIVSQTTMQVIASSHLS